MNRPTSANPLRAPEQAGLTSVFAAHTSVRARAVELKWRWPITLALLSTVPSFYVELLHEQPPLFAVLSYLLAAATMIGALLHVGLRSGNLRAHLRANHFDLALCAGLVAAAMLPPSAGSELSLWFRVLVGFFTLLLGLAGLLRTGRRP